jgi:uncharacterized membrane protein YbhN (UPF0104 family)
MTTSSTSQPRSRPRWRLALGVLLSLGALGLALLNRQWILEAIQLVGTARPLGLAAALLIILTSFLTSSQVLRVALRALGHAVGVLRMWAISLVAIVLSQLLPAGGLGSYAFLLHAFRRYGATPAEAALVPTLEGLSYTVAMVLFATFGMAELAASALAGGSSRDSLAAALLAGLAALLAVGVVVLVLTRSAATLTRLLLALNRAPRGLLRVLGQPWGDAWVHAAVAEIVRGRALVAGHARLIALLVLIQMAALAGHSVALFVILRSLGAPAGLHVAIAAFGIALLISSFNVLPGGGGTVETALVAVLAHLGVGPAALPAAILFRLLDFWAILPLAGAGYAWLSRGWGVAGDEGTFG